ncbi:MAG: hypothetical protein ABR991_13650 [Terracidiphilus sp.]|jgi:type II secretory pathway pseudopilin PulG
MKDKRISILSGQVRHRGGESGYMLLGVIVLAAILAISLSVAAPQIAREIQRDRELECIHRGQQYARAIRLYYRHTGNFPTDIAQLENTNNLRFLRKRYIDPATRSEWKLVYQGEVKPEMLDHGREMFGVSYPFSSPGSLAGGILPSIASVPPGASGNGSIGGLTQLVDPISGKAVSASSDTGTQTSPDFQTAAAVGTTGNAGALVSNRPIVGVSSFSDKKSIIVYKKMAHYSDWQFIYDPASDGIAGGGQPGANGPSLPANPSMTSNVSSAPTQ